MHFVVYLECTEKMKLFSSGDSFISLYSVLVIFFNLFRFFCCLSTCSDFSVVCDVFWARCKKHWSRSTSCFSFLTLHKSWDKIETTEHIKLNRKVKQTSLRFFLYMWNKEKSYKLKQEVFLDQCCLHLAKWSIYIKIFVTLQMALFKNK